MAKVLGIGGVFFKSSDPKKLTSWYERTLGFPVDEGGSVSFQPAKLPQTSFSVWGPFQESTKYFNPSEKRYMFNLIVDDLDEALAQVANAGAEIVGEIEEYEFGRFGWFLDPEGHKVELWQPPADD